MIEGGFETSVGNFLNGYQDGPTAGNVATLVCYIKKFKLTQHDSLKNISVGLRYIKTQMKAEVFVLKEGMLQPAARFDTCYYISEREEADRGGMVEGLLAYFAAKCSRINMPAVYKRSKYAGHFIDSSYQNLLDKPIVIAVKTAPGIYASFQEFVDNAPSIIDYKLEWNLKGPMLYTKDVKGEWGAYSGSYYGVCDGDTLYIKHQYGLYPITKTGKTFEAYCYNGLVSQKNYLASALMGDGLKRVQRLFEKTGDKMPIFSLYEIDMETGEIY